MNLKPGSIPWAEQALRNAQQASQRARDAFLQHSMTQEAVRAEEIRAASEELANRITITPPPKRAA